MCKPPPTPWGPVVGVSREREGRRMDSHAYQDGPTDMEDSVSVALRPGGF